eukprot:7899023-Pyramimonas_sp.AAC.1
MEVSCITSSSPSSSYSSSSHSSSDLLLLPCCIHNLPIPRSVCSSRLSRKVDSIKNVPIDDAIAEGPHSLAKRLQDHSRAATWAWAAS